MKLSSKILIEGPSGSGKTHCIQTIPPSYETFVISTEPGIEHVLGHVPCPRLHWHFIPPTVTSWDTLLTSASRINTLSYKQLAEAPPTDRYNFQQFVEVLRTCNDFHCDRCGQSFGDVMKWGPERVLVVDSLTGLSMMAMDLAVGTKPTKSMSDWMVAMDNLERFINTLAVGLKCQFVLNSHVEREVNEVSGQTLIGVSTLGRKLAPKIPRFFDNVVLTVREGTKFYWSTAAAGVDLKASRGLPIAERLQPELSQVFLP